MKKKKRLRWAGHVRRMKESETPKRILEYKMDGKRRVGCPRLRWEHSIVKGIKRTWSERMVECGDGQE